MEMKGESSDVIIAEAPCLPGCFTQGQNFEETRENLTDVIINGKLRCLQN